MKPFLQSGLRAIRIITTFLRLIIIQRLLWWRIPRLSEAVRFRMTLETLGGTWIKLGQILALRFDILPAEYCYELFKLLNQVAPFPYATVRNLIKDDLGKYPEDLFSNFEEEAFAAASIGQVHRATLQDGRKIVIKVQRPDIRQIMSNDIGLMYALSGLIDAIGIFGASPSRAIIDEFANTVYAEIDYRNEARHATMIARHAQDDNYEVNAAIVWDYCSERILACEQIDGIPLIDILEAIGQNNQAYLKTLETQGYSLKRIAQRIDLNMLNQIFVHGYFHADLHPANIFVLPGNAIAYVDFGIVGQMSNDLRESLLQYTWLFFEGDSDRAIRHLMRWIQSEEPEQHLQAYRALLEVHERFYFNLSHPHQAQKGIVSGFAIEVFTTVRENRLVLAPELVLFLRTLITVSTIRYELFPEYDLRSSTRRFFNEMISQEVSQLVEGQSLMRMSLNYNARINNVLNYFEQQQLSAAHRPKSHRTATLNTLGILFFLLLLTDLIIFWQTPTSAMNEAFGSSPLVLLHFALLIICALSIWRRRD